MDAPATQRSTFQRVARSIAWLLLALLVIALALALYLRSDAGHRSLADGLEKLVSKHIPGTMKIGRLESFGLFEPVVDDLEFIHPDGTTVLHLDHAEVDVNVSQLLRGRLGFHSAAVSGGRILLDPQPDGRTSLEAALDAPSLVKGPSKPGDGFHYRMRSIHVQRLVVAVGKGKDETLRLLNTEGFVAITRETTPGVQIELERIKGMLDRKLLGADVELMQADGAIHGKEKRIVDLRLQLRISDSRLTGRLAVFDRKKTPVELTLHTEGAEAKVAAMGLKLGSWFTDTVRVEWK